jgi:hypothetical protein
MRYLPMNYMPLRRILSEMHAHDIHARKMHTHEAGVRHSLDLVSSRTGNSFGDQ